MVNIVNFELAKLLKEKQCNIETNSYYSEDGTEYSNANKEDWNLRTNLISAPTIAEVINWLYLDYDIWISVHDASGFACKIQYMNIDGDSTVSIIQHFPVPSLAYEHAIEYVLSQENFGILNADQFLTESLEVSHFYDDTTQEMVCFASEVRKAMVNFAKYHVERATAQAVSKPFLNEADNIGQRILNRTYLENIK